MAQRSLRFTIKMRGRTPIGEARPEVMWRALHHRTASGSGRFTATQR
jgi:hypothetical protein